MTLVKISGTKDQVNKEYDDFFNQADKFFDLDIVDEVEDAEGVLIEFESLPIGAVAYINNNNNIEIVE